MANQKITDLNKLQKLSKQDLLIVVDRSSTTTSSSPTGETMAIEANTLASQLAEIHQGDVGIKLPSLADVPNEYEGWGGGYLKISENEDGIEFTDAPGASEMSVPLYDANSVNNFYITDLDPTSDPTVATVITIDSYHVGDTLRRDSSTNKFRHAVSKVSDDRGVSTAEVVGIIRKIKRSPAGEVEFINISFGGHVIFDEFPWIENETTAGTDPAPTPNIPLVDGETYFLGPNGALTDYDPTTTVIDGVHVSKPMLIATSDKSGVVVNYRGLVCEKSEEPHKFIVEHDATCSNIKVGDVVRVKRKIQKFANQFGSDQLGKINEFEGDGEQVRPSYLSDATGDSPYVLSNAASVLTDSEVDDSYGCDVLGIVTIATTEYFQIQTTGMITFDIPVGQTNYIPTSGSSTPARLNRQGAIFKAGYVYYLDHFDPTPDTPDKVQRSGLSLNIYDYTLAEFSELYDDPTNAVTPDNDMIAVTTGIRPFRNTTIENPFNRDDTTGRVISYSKPVFYAVNDRQILLMNQPAYPPAYDRCNAVDPLIASPCIERTSAEHRHLTTSEEPYTKDNVTIFLNSAWKNAKAKDIAFITHQGYELVDPAAEIGYETYRAAAGKYATIRWQRTALSVTELAEGLWTRYGRVE